MAAPATMVRLPCSNPETAIRPRRKGRAIQPAQHSPSSTASVALWVAAAKAVNANSEPFSTVEILLPVHDQDKQRQHRQTGKDVGQQHGGEPGQRRGQRSGQMLIAISRHGRGHAEHAQRQLQDPQRRQRLNAQIDPEVANPRRNAGRARTRWTAGDQIAFVPPGQIAAGVLLQQRIAVPQRRQRPASAEARRRRSRPRPGRSRARAKSAY